MAISTFMGLETSLRGLLAQQQALDVTSHNIANASTTGYSRQTAVLVASPAYAMPGVSTAPAGAGQLGTGVDVAAYQRIRDSFLDVQYRAQSMLQGQAQANQDGLQQVQLAFNEQPTSTGLSGLLANYWSAWQNLSNNPEDMGTRQALVQSAASLADGFTSLSGQLTTQQSQTAQNVSDTLTQANSFGTQIAQLNLTISKLEVSGDTPNDLLDQRDVLLDKLSALGNVSTTAGANGSVNVTFGGAALVAGGASSTLAETDLTGLSSGKLQGLITLRDTTIPGYQAQLNTIATTLILKTNTQSALGFDLSGNPGGAFFTGTDASDITVNPALISNPGLVAASASGAVGDAGNALAIADMQSTAVIGSSTIDTAYTQLVTQVGSDVQQSTNQVSTTTALVNALQNSRQSVSGVNLDEEMTNLITYQRGYQASARALSAMDSMLDQLINRTGRVGL